MRISHLLLSAATALTLATGVGAHALLERAEPRVGAIVARPPAAVRLTFTDALEVVFCRVSITGPAGFGGAGAVRPVPGDPRSLVVDLHTPVPPGAYVVRWRATSLDTHVTEGDFTFQVRP